MLGKKPTGGRRRPLRMAVQHMLPDALQFISSDYHDDDDADDNGDYGCGDEIIAEMLWFISRSL